MHIAKSHIGIVVALLVILSGCSVPPQLQTNESPANFACEIDSECWYTCDTGCVNQGWAKNHLDTCNNIRAGECTCVDNYCNTDGRPPKR